MKYFVAVCMWLALSVGALIYSREADLPSKFHVNSPINLMLVEWGILFVVCIGGAAMIGRERRVEVSPGYSALQPRIDARFPARDIFRVPPEVPVFLGFKERGSYFHEDFNDLWEAMLNKFPAPPRTEAERVQGETTFWNKYVNVFTISDAGGKPFLTQKQTIIDHFRNWEKWIFREYYAATGVVKKTIFQEYSRIILERKKIWDRRFSLRGFTEDATKNKEHEQKYESALEKESNFARTTFDNHMEKEGEWFFYNIEAAFTRAHAKAQDFGPQTPATPPQHPAQDDLSYKPNT